MVRLFLLATASTACLAIASPVNAQSSTETYTYDALGRLITTKTVGGQNNNETHTICYDDAGNRTQYVAGSSGSAGNCGGGAPPPPPPPPPPPNGPPVSSDDFASGTCTSTRVVNLTANDSDPDGDALTLVSIVKTLGTGSATITNASLVNVVFPFSNFGYAQYTYTVRDPSGATDTAILTLLGTCGGGPLF